MSNKLMVYALLAANDDDYYDDEPSCPALSSTEDSAKQYATEIELEDYTIEAVEVN